MNELDKNIGRILIEYYDTMKQLESDKHKSGKQATALIMAINDIQGVFSSKPDVIKSVCDCEEKQEILERGCYLNCPLCLRPLK